MTERLQNDTGRQADDQLFQHRLNALLADRAEPERRLIARAAQLARDAHHGQRRVSGEPYYLHSLAVAEILNGLNLDYETLAAAILHDVVEDTDVTLEGRKIKELYEKQPDYYSGAH